MLTMIRNGIKKNKKICSSIRAAASVYKKLKKANLEQLHSRSLDFGDCGGEKEICLILQPSPGARR